VPVLESGEAGGRCYLAVRLVEGRSLAERIGERPPLELREVARIAVHVGRALDSLHAAGLVHRDVKPENVMLAPEGALLTDFGLARGAGYTILTRPGEVMGTLDYLAPELVLGQPASPASDLYALGCLVYECVAGKAPFADTDVLRVATAHVEQAPPDPREARPELSADLAFAILAPLAKHPRERPATGRMYGQLLRVALH